MLVTSFFKETTRISYYSPFRFILKELDFLISWTLREERDQKKNKRDLMEKRLLGVTPILLFINNLIGKK